MAKDEGWTTVEKKVSTGRPKDATKPAQSSTSTTGSSGGSSIYKKGLAVGRNVGGSSSNGPVQKKCK